MANLAINGFGRIGRAVLKIILEKYPQMKVVAWARVFARAAGRLFSRCPDPGDARQGGEVRVDHRPRVPGEAPPAS